MTVDGTLIALWEPDKHPREWQWVRLSPYAWRLETARFAADGATLETLSWYPSGWTVVREYDGVEAEVYLPL